MSTFSYLVSAMDSGRSLPQSISISPSRGNPRLHSALMEEHFISHRTGEVDLAAWIYTQHKWIRVVALVKFATWVVILTRPAMRCSRTLPRTASCTSHPTVILVTEC